MKTIVESIRDRRGGPILRRIKHPSYKDLKPYNIIKVNRSEGSLYGIVMDKIDALFHDHSEEGSVFFYSPGEPALYFQITRYKQSFPKLSWFDPDDTDDDYQIEGVWSGSDYKDYFKKLFRKESGAINLDAIMNFLQLSYDNPKEFEKMLSK